jgi:hypothetical protein
MIPFRVIRSGVLLTGLLAALATLSPAASGGFTATLSPEQKSAAGLDTLTPGELTVLDHLVATDVARARRAPAVNNPYTQRYTESETKAAGLDRLTPDQLAKLDTMIAAALAAAPRSQASPQPRERPRLRDDGIILSEPRRLQVHGGMSLTVGSAGGGRNFHEAGAWVSYFDPVTGLGLAISYSRYSGDALGGYYGPGYSSGAPYLYPAPRPMLTGIGGAEADHRAFPGDGAYLRYPAVGRFSDRDFRR